MNAKYNYMKPEAEIVTLEMEGNVMLNVSGGSASQDLSSAEDYAGGAAGGRQRSFWSE